MTDSDRPVPSRRSDPRLRSFPAGRRATNARRLWEQRRGGAVAAYEKGKERGGGVAEGEWRGVGGGA